MAEAGSGSSRESAPLTIRQARADDIDALGVITGRAYAATYPGIVPDAVLDEWIGDAPSMWVRWREAVEERPPDHPSRAWVAERDGVLLGYATTAAARDEYLPPPDGAGELTNLYIAPDAIGSGVGSALFDHAVADLRVRGFNPFVVWAFRDNERAVRFYERKGAAIDIPRHDWMLGGTPCPIVRLRIDWPATGPG